jgi:hypothetical protein
MNLLLAGLVFLGTNLASAESSVKAYNNAGDQFAHNIETAVEGKLLSSHGKITFYSTPRERDFGTPGRNGTDTVTYTGPEGARHQSRFVKGFAGRNSQDPVNKDISGAAMEGNGLIEPAFHNDDPYLKKAVAAGYHVLNLENWNEKTRTATFNLSRDVLGSNENPLREHLSAAVRTGDRLIHPGDCVGIVLGSREFIGYRLIDDSCSSCERDDHIDIYEPTTFAKNLEGPAMIYLVEKNKCIAITGSR